MGQPAAVYTISHSEDSALGVEVLRSGLLGRKRKHTIAFENFKGELHLVDRDPAASKIVLSIDSSSVVCRDKSISERKRQSIVGFIRKDALETDRYPEIQFASTSIRPKTLRGFVVRGILQLHGTNREVTINMAFNPMRKHEFQLDGDATLRLSDFGLPRPSGMFGLIGTTNEVMVHLLLWAVPGAQPVQAVP